MSLENEVFKLHGLAVKDAGKYPKRREIHKEISNDFGKHFLGISGLRGVGKSVVLKQLAAATPDSIYISLDTLAGGDVFTLVEKLSADYGVTTFFLDEVHFCDKIDETLKKIYDFLDVKIVFTSSVALGMSRSAFDLSRRVKLIRMFPFSFREYLLFKNGVAPERLSLRRILDGEWSADHLIVGHLFEPYLKGGNMPFSIDEPDIFPLLQNIMHTIVHKDIPRIAKVAVNELDSILKTITFIGKSEVDGINYSSLSRNVGITKYKAQSYVELLKDAFVLHRVMPTGTNVLKEPKIVLAPPFRLLFRDYQECIGGLREDFFVEMLGSAGLDFHYLKTTRGGKIPDYLVHEGNEKIIAEIGGKGKGREQFKGITGNKQVIFTHSDRQDGIRRPLSLAGFLP